MVCIGVGGDFTAPKLSSIDEKNQDRLKCPGSLPKKFPISKN